MCPARNPVGSMAARAKAVWVDGRQMAGRGPVRLDDGLGWVAGGLGGAPFGGLYLAGRPRPRA